MYRTIAYTRTHAEEASAELGHIPALPTDKPTWVVDPIDGTQNFVHGESHHSNMTE